MPPSLKLSKGATTASGLIPVTIEAWYTPDRAGAPTVDLRMVYDLDVLELDSATVGYLTWQNSSLRLCTVVWQGVRLSAMAQGRTAHFSWIHPRILETTVEGHLDIGAVAGVSSQSVVLYKLESRGSEPFPGSGADPA